MFERFNDTPNYDKEFEGIIGKLLNSNPEIARKADMVRPTIANQQTQFDHIYRRNYQQWRDSGILEKVAAMIIKHPEGDKFLGRRQVGLQRAMDHKAGNQRGTEVWSLLVGGADSRKPEVGRDGRSKISIAHIPFARDTGTYMTPEMNFTQKQVDIVAKQIIELDQAREDRLMGMPDLNWDLLSIGSSRRGFPFPRGSNFYD